MKATVAIALAFALIAPLAGTASANPKNDPESAFVLDLTAAGANSYHIHCQHNAELSSCRSPSLWENTNALPALQTGKTATTSGLIGPDSLLLG